MTATIEGRGTGEPAVMDPIHLEVVRSRLDAISEQAGAAIEHTAISPTITESKDYSVTLMDPIGGLIAGAGPQVHFGAATHAVRSTIARFGNSIASGDVFFANDPHSGGGLHPQDVMIQRPIFSDGVRVGWVALSAHMMDMGGMVVGSFAPMATECYQEALRLPPVRLFQRGEEMSDVWAIIINNIRMSELVEMDLRGLVAGSHLAQDRVEAVVDDIGRHCYLDSLDAIQQLSETEMRRRISALEDGVYRATSWTEYGEEFFRIPCNLTVDGDRLVLDYEGASPQTEHFFNSKPYIIKSAFAVMMAHRIARDLPFNEGITAPIELRCPPGTIVNSNPPAPISAAHMHVGMNAADVGMQALSLAVGASPNSPARRYLAGAGYESGLGNNLWSWQLPDGTTDAYIVIDGIWAGASAGRERDGLDLGRNPVGVDGPGSIPDIEILESWFPLLFTERRARPGQEGGGVHRAGGGAQISFRPHGIDQINGTMFGMRRWMPLQGIAGGSPGACLEFLVHHSDGSSDILDTNSTGTPVRTGESFQMRLPCGGGFGDPLDRPAEAVALDVAAGKFSAQEAGRVYGAVLHADGSVDHVATTAQRDRIRQDRLARATPPVRPLGHRRVDLADARIPLYPGVVQQENLAVAEESGQVLAEAPDHWTDGCPVLEERRWPDSNPAVVSRTYLDPLLGRALHVEVALADAPRSFEVSPRRWTKRV